jgi:carbamoyltransferase
MTTTKPTYTLGISGFYNSGIGVYGGGPGHDAAACLVRDGELVAAAAEERFIRIKHAVGHFPERAIRFCLDKAGIGFEDLAAVAWSNDPTLAGRRWASAGRFQPVKKGLLRGASLVERVEGGSFGRLLSDELRPSAVIERQRTELVSRFPGPQPPFFCFDHHLSHAASAYYTSGYDRSAILTWDGNGDGLSGIIARGSGPDIEVLTEISEFSVGELYWAVHSLLRLSDEGSLMGLAAYGNRQPIFRPVADADRLWMDMTQIRAINTWNKLRSTPYEFVRSLGPPRSSDDPLEQRHKDIAASLQQVVEEFGMRLAKEAISLTSENRLCMAGGVALNAVFNGKLTRAGLFDSVFVHPAPGDDGGAAGAAFLAYRKLGGAPKCQAMTSASLGASFDDDQIAEMLAIAGVPAERLNDSELPETVADEVASGSVVGWFQGAMEWGPRALGNRSIIADPRTVASRDKVNRVVKYRDPWRPFAPSMLASAASDLLRDPHEAPFMLTTFEVTDAAKREIPAVVHADHTTRPQLVHQSVAPRYHDMISAFGRRTGVPAVVNTSFNLKGEPVVCTPLDALRTFIASGMDALVLGNHLVVKPRVVGRQQQ